MVRIDHTLLAELDTQYKIRIDDRYLVIDTDLSPAEEIPAVAYLLATLANMLLESIEEEPNSFPLDS